MNQTRTIRLPIHVVKELSQKLDHEPTHQDITKLLDKPLADVKRMMGLNERVTSVDTPLGPDSERSILDTVPDIKQADRAEKQIQVEELKRLRETMESQGLYVESIFN